MLTPRGGGIFKGTSSTKKPPLAPPSVHDNDLLPEPCTSPKQHGHHQEALDPRKQHLLSPSSGYPAGNSSDTGSNMQQHGTVQPDSALMDFWVLLQQTQSNLQVGPELRRLQSSAASPP